MTVSNVINGKFNLMSPATRETIYGVISKLNYRPHSRARNLRLSQDFSIGLIVVDPSRSLLADPFTTYVVAGLSNYMSERRYGLLQGVNTHDLSEPPVLRQHQTDAVCVMVSGGIRARRDLYRNLWTANQPFVILQEVVPDSITDAIAVRQDDRGGGAMLARQPC